MCVRITAVILFLMMPGCVHWGNGMVSPMPTWQSCSTTPYRQSNVQCSGCPSWSTTGAVIIDEPVGGSTTDMRIRELTNEVVNLRHDLVALGQRPVVYGQIDEQPISSRDGKVHQNDCDFDVDTLKMVDLMIILSGVVSVCPENDQVGVDMRCEEEGKVVIRASNGDNSDNYIIRGWIQDNYVHFSVGSTILRADQRADEAASERAVIEMINCIRSQLTSRDNQ